MAQFWTNKVILAKLEAAYGVDPVPTGALDAVLATNVTLTPMAGQDVSRELELPSMGAQPTIPAGLNATLAFEVEMTASGVAGTPPAWGRLMRACAVAEVISAGVSVAYNPVSQGHESISLHFNVDGTRFLLGGARGTAVLRIGAQAVPKIAFTFTGIYAQPTALALPVPVLTAWPAPLLATSVNTPVFTIGGTALVMRSLDMDLGNAVETRFLIGSESVFITGRGETIATTVDAVPLATLNPFQLAQSQATSPLILQHGTAAGGRITLNAPRAQMQRPSGLGQSQNIVEWPLSLVPLATGAGDDQWTLTLT